MKKILQLILSLTIISAVCAAVLAVVNDITKARIANIAVLKANNAARAVLPPGVQAIDVREDPSDKAVKIFVAYSDAAKKTVLGYAVPGHSGSGYGGDIRLMVGLTPARAVVTYQVLAASETPGLGAKLGDAGFVKQFAAKPAATLKVKKDGGEIDAITGATITSRAVCGAIADACARVDRLEGKAPATAAPKAPAAQEGKIVLDPAKEETAKLVLRKGTATAMPVKDGSRFPIFVGKDAAGAVTGYAVVGTGKGKGPEGEIIVHYLYGFTADGRLSPAARPRPVNQLDITHVEMIKAQTDALNAAMKDAQSRLAAHLGK